jgi:hypothetical protein
LILHFVLTDYLASYLINGDATGLKDEEIAEIDVFIEKESIYIVSMNDDSHFRHSNDLHSSGCNCSTYIAHKETD